MYFLFVPKNANTIVSMTKISDLLQGSNTDTSLLKTLSQSCNSTQRVRSHTGVTILLYDDCISLEETTMRQSSQVINIKHVTSC